jgi:uncharacterized protein YoxC
MDITQIVISVISILLTVLMIILGVQVWHILKEFKETIKKTNTLLDDANSLTKTIKTSADDFSSMSAGLKAGFSLVSRLFSKKGEEYE